LRLVAHHNVGESHGGERHQPRIGIATDLDRLSDDPACLGFKGCAVGAPIDEIGRNQRCKQRQNQQTANGDE